MACGTMTRIVAPAALLSCCHLVLGGIVLWVPQLRVMEFLGHVLLVDEMTRVVMGILVVLAIAQLLHQPRGSVAQV